MGHRLSRFRNRVRQRFGHRSRPPINWNTVRNVQRQRPYQVYCRLVDPPIRTPRIDPKSGYFQFWKSPYEKEPNTLDLPEIPTIHNSSKHQEIGHVVVIYGQGHQYEISVETSEENVDLDENIIRAKNKLKLFDEQLNRFIWDAGDTVSDSLSATSSECDEPHSLHNQKEIQNSDSKRRFSSSNGDPAAEEITIIQDSPISSSPIWVVPMDSYPPFLQPFINKQCRLYLRYDNSNVAPHTMEKSTEAVYLMQNIKFLKVQFIQHSLNKNQMKICIEESHRAKRGRRKGCFRPMYCKTVILDCEHFTITAIGEDFLLHLQPPREDQTQYNFPDSNGELPKLWGYYVRELDTNPNISLEWSACLWKWYNNTEQYKIDN